MGEIRFDQAQIICGTALRHAIPHFLKTRFIVYDPHRKASNNDLILCKIKKIPKGRKRKLAFRSNMIERAYYKNGKYLFVNEDIRDYEGKKAIIVVGSRYSTLSFAGGLFNPITGEINGEIYGGKTIHNLGRMNIAGFLNYNYGDEEPVELEVIGVMVDQEGNSLKLTNFREEFYSEVVQKRQRCCTIIILGMDMESGKTTCAKALAQELNKLQYIVTFEKKTGGPFCRDWINVFREGPGVFSEISSQIEIDLAGFKSRDFIDATGCISSHTVEDYDDFVRKSIEFTYYFVSQKKSDFHIMEFAGNLSEGPNLCLLENLCFKNIVDIIILAAPQNYENICQCIFYLSEFLGYDKNRIILSGYLGNDSCPKMIREEVAWRLKLPICKSANLSGKSIESYGKQLVSEILRMRGLYDRK